MSSGESLASVTQLPDSMQRQWRVYERELIAQMAESGSSPEEISIICANVKPIFLKAADMNKGFSCDPKDALEVINQWVRQQVSVLLTEIVIREVKLYRAGL